MPQREITGFTGLRAVAAWWVVLFHFSEVAPAPWPLHALIRGGPYAVDLFFIMSGYVIALRYAPIFSATSAHGLFATRTGLRALAAFLILRLGRVYPLHLVVLLLYVSVPATLLATGRPIADYRFPPLYFLESLVLIQNWGVTTRFSWNLPAWSISTELLFYLVFPLLAAASGRTLARRPGLVLSGLVIAAWIATMGWLLGGLIVQTPRFGALRCLSECMLGVWLCHVVLRAPPGRTAARALIAASSALAAACALGILPDYLALPAAFACLLAALTQPATLLARALSSPVPMALGALSFSTYLVHYLVKDWIKLLLAGRVPTLMLFGAYVLAVIAASVVLHRLVESPGRSASRRLANGIRSGPAPHLAPAAAGR